MGEGGKGVCVLVVTINTHCSKERYCTRTYMHEPNLINFLSEATLQAPSHFNIKKPQRGP